jgi:integrase
MPIYKNKNKQGYTVKINYTDDKGNHKQILRCNKDTLKKEDARDLERRLMEEIEQKTIATNQKITLNQLFHCYVKDFETQRKANTMRQLKSVYKNQIGQYLGNLNIYKMTARDIQRWQTEINHKKIKVGHKNTIFKNLRKLLNYAVKMYDLPSNPCAKVEPFKDTKSLEDDHIQYFTYEQFKTFDNELLKRLNKAKQSNQISQFIRLSQGRIFFNVLFYAGLRKGEANALNWGDIIEENNTLFLNITKSINQKTCPYEITKPKNKTSIRKVPICDELKRLLYEHKSLCKNCIDGFNEKYFITGALNPLCDTFTSDLKNDIIKSCKLPNIRIHDFRHSYCSLLINGGVPLYVIARLLGHSTIEITQKVYAHIYPDSFTQALNCINALK